MARGSASFKTAQGPASDTVVLTVPAGPTRVRVTIAPSASVRYAVGPTPDVSLTNGLIVYNGAPITIETAAAVYVIAESGITISYMEEY